MNKAIWLLIFYLLFALHARSQQSRIYTISFAKNKSALSPDNKIFLSFITDTLQLKNNYKVYINGHSDSDADSSYNMQLSLKRSLAVREFLIQNGISEEIITTRAMGEDQPLVKNSTPLAKSKNRRVELIVLYEQPPATIVAEPPIFENKTKQCNGGKKPLLVLLTSN